MQANKLTSNDGTVTATSDLRCGGTIVPDCKVFDIFMDMDFDGFGVPNIHRVWIFAYTAKENIAKLTAEQRVAFCKPLNDTHCYVMEPIEIDDALRKRFDAAGLTKKFLASVITGK